MLWLNTQNNMSDYFINEMDDRYQDRITIFLGWKLVSQNGQGGLWIWSVIWKLVINPEDNQHSRIFHFIFQINSHQLIQEGSLSWTRSIPHMMKTIALLGKPIQSLQVIPKRWSQKDALMIYVKHLESHIDAN